MASLLILILGLPLLMQPATTHGSISAQPSNQNNLSSQEMNDFQQPLPVSHHSSWIKERVDNRLYRDLLLPLWPNYSINEGSGDGSGLQQSPKVIMPSSGLLEMDRFIQNRAEKLGFEEISPPAPPVTQRLTQHVVNNDQDIILANKNSGLYQATSTMPVQLTTLTHTTYINNNVRINKDQPLLTTIKPNRERKTTVNSTPVNMYVETFTTHDKFDYSTQYTVQNNENAKTFQETKYAPYTQSLSSITKPEMLGHNGTIVMQSDFIQESFDNLMVKEEHYVTNHAPTATPPIQTGQSGGEGTTSDLQIPIELLSTNPSITQAKINTDKTKKKDENSKWFGGLLGLLTASSQSGTTSSCIQGPCVVSTGNNITRLQWEDLKRTLTFAWDLHVYGSAILFLLLVVVAIFGVIGGAQMLHPFSEVFILANILLLLAGLLRFVQFIIDPYGTRNILPRPTLSALYNLPVPLLLWAQATLSLLFLRQERLTPYPTSPQRLSVTGGLAALHGTSILMADLLSNTLSPALPLMLQTLTVCWGLPLCLGIFFQSLKQLCSSHRTTVLRWSAPKRLVNSVRRVLLLCAVLGVFSCALQIYGFLWLYGLLGDWRRFGWSWWLGQLGARLLELAWSFSLLLLGSQVFWRPQGVKGKQEQRKQTKKREQKQKEMLHMDRLLETLPMGLWRRPDRNWAELLPNNWEEQKQSKENVSRLMTQNQAAPTTSVTTVHDNNQIIGGGVLYNSSNDYGGVLYNSSNDYGGVIYNSSNDYGGVIYNSSNDYGHVNDHATPLWTSGVEWQEHECLLSFIEFDLPPHSPVNLSHSIDCALPHAHLLGVGTIFTPSTPSWTQNEGLFEGNIKSATIPTKRAYRWALDPCSKPISNQHFGTPIQQTRVSVIEPLASLTPETIRKVWERDSAIPRFTVDDDWSSIASDDVTSL